MSQPSASSRRRPLDLLRWVFLVAVLGFAWWGMRGRWHDLAAAVAATPGWAVVVAATLVLVGVALTSTVWLTLLRGFGRDLPPAEGRAIFFVGQLGKYLPGSVWTIGVQAELARRHRVPLRTTVAASLVFLGVHVATAGLVAAAAGLTGVMPLPGPRWALALVAAVAVAGLTPWSINRCGSAVAGGDRCRLSGAAVAGALAVQACTWVCYAGAIAVLAPSPSPHLFAVAAGAFTAAYAVGVVVVLAPAGVGAREVVLIGLSAPVTGVTAATALALLARALHTVADLALAGGSWLRARRLTRSLSVAPDTVSS